MNVSHLECSRCRAEVSHRRPVQLCPHCNSPLLVRYDLKAVGATLHKTDLAGRPADLWRYRELLPVENRANEISLGEGMTPLLSLKRLGPQMGLPGLMVKDEGALPTGSFKARGAALGVSRAKELGIDALAMPTAGNAGGAWAAYCAAAGIRAVIVMPKDAQVINIKECAAAGATLYLIEGILDDAGPVVARAVERHGWFDASTLKEPYRIEGKKTMGLEIAEQLAWQLPDVLLYPTGGGVGIIALYKAFQELVSLGWIEPPLPRLVAVQSSACAPIPKAWAVGADESQYWPDPDTTIPGLRVPKALGDFLVLRSIYATDGCAVAVSDDEAYAAQRLLARTEGLFVCPEGAATLAAAANLRSSGWIKAHERVVLLNTGSGLKYADTIPVQAPVIKPKDDLPA